MIGGAKNRGLPPQFKIKNSIRHKRMELKLVFNKIKLLLLALF